MPTDLTGGVVVVIDVLRATTTIVYALENGARSIIPCEEPDEALAVRERLGASHVLLGGERDSVRIAGFDLDNSPLSYARENVEGRSIAFTTTNGTRALKRAMHASAQAVLCGAFVNLSAVLDYLRRIKPPTVLLACAGSEGSMALEDVLVAGALADRLASSVAGVALSDAAKAAVLAYKGAAADLYAAIASAEHARALIRAGFKGDIALAAQIDSARVVPMLKDGEIVRQTTASART